MFKVPTGSGVIASAGSTEFVMIRSLDIPADFVAAFPPCRAYTAIRRPFPKNTSKRLLNPLSNLDPLQQTANSQTACQSLSMNLTVARYVSKHLPFPVSLYMSLLSKPLIQCYQKDRLLSLRPTSQ